MNEPFYARAFYNPQGQWPAVPVLRGCAHL
jgi:hypothetical protein